MTKKIRNIIVVTVIATVIIICAGYEGIKANKDSIEFINNAENIEMENPLEKIGYIMAGKDVPEIVLSAAREQVEKLFEINKAEYSNYNYTNWRIERLAYSYTYDDLEGMKLVIFQMNYELLSESPEEIMPVGGMYITEDNWVMPNYPNSIYLIFKQDGEELIFLHLIVENDCVPGNQLFTEDLLRITFQ